MELFQEEAAAAEALGGGAAAGAGVAGPPVAEGEVEALPSVSEPVSMESTEDLRRPEGGTAAGGGAAAGGGGSGGGGGGGGSGGGVLQVRVCVGCVPASLAVARCGFVSLVAASVSKLPQRSAAFQPPPSPSVPSTIPLDRFSWQAAEEVVALDAVAESRAARGSIAP